MAGISNAIAAREQRKAAEAEAEANKGKTITWVIVSLIIVIGLIIGIVIYKRNKKSFMDSLSALQGLLSYFKWNSLLNRTELNKFLNFLR